MSDLSNAILQFLWQGLVIGAIAWIGLHCVPRTNAPVRYAISCAAMAASMIAFVVTLGWTWATTAQPAAIGTAELSVTQLQSALHLGPELGAMTSSFDRTRVVSWAWLLGFLVMFLRFLQSARWAWRLKATTTLPQDSRPQSVLDELTQELGIRRVVRLMQSVHIDGPVVVGWLRPLVVVPASTLTGLSPEHLRCVLAHELAHIRRFDHLVNALQALVEVTLFFHPVVWWLSRQMRAEREHCCDLAAIRTTGNARLLAEALTQLESIRLLEPQMALAAKAQVGPLMQRINRILDSRTSSSFALGRGLRTAFAAGALLLAVGVAQGGVEAPAPELNWSVADDDIVAEFRKITERIQQAVAAGELTPADARKTLAALRKTMFKDAKPAERPVRSEEDMRRIHEEMSQMVKDGKISQEDMDRRLSGMRRRMAADAGEPRFTREQYAEAAERMKEMVAAGEISQGDMDRRLSGMRQRMAADAGEPRFTREQYAESAEQMKKMVAAGEISQEDMDRRLSGMRRRMAANAGEPRFTREQYAEAAEQMKKMVAAGEITEEAMRARLAGMRARIRKGGGQRKAPTAADYERAEAEIKKMVADGKVTREAGEERLDRLKEAIEQGSDRAAQEEAQRKYHEAEAEIKKMVAEGKISGEDASQRLKELYEHYLGDKKAADESKQTNIDAATERIEAAVKAGKMTRAQADAKLKALSGGKRRKQTERDQRSGNEVGGGTDRDRR